MSNVPPVDQANMVQEENFGGKQSRGRTRQRNFPNRQNTSNIEWQQDEICISLQWFEIDGYYQ
jgi:hypothetical protein